ncbi:hypothetical protein O6H91_14G024900 [Diphasiastrum complanatum]|uniref:Uncharacterized protein n=1 Tax=Diphasiastrum complanatum TaxID=34168 RepID=A0ACC2BMD9_DIPCM|nr:hypothetical protein O6H91_14G024900 [Diphasiastrum complanatum]
MLEQLLIFTRGGLVLWTCRELGNALKGSPIDALIRSCLLEERAGDEAFQYDAPGAAYTLKWTFHNECGLVFVAVYQRILHLLYVDELLNMVKREFSGVYNPKRTSYYDFDDTFRQLSKAAEARADEFRRTKQAMLADTRKKGIDPKSKSDKAQKKGSKSSKKTNGKEAGKDGDSDEDDEGNGNSVRSANGKVGGGSSHDSGVTRKVSVENNGGSGNSSDEAAGKKASEIAFNVDKLQKLRKGAKKGSSVVVKAPKEELGKKVKKNRVWGEAAPPSKLDFTDPSDEQGEAKVAILENRGKSLMDNEEEEKFSESEFEEDADGEGNNGKPAAKKMGWFSSIFQSVAGKSALEKTDLEPSLKALKERLMTKNVAEEIAEKLCESVAVSLIGKKLGSFTRVASTVQAAMEDALLRILTPKRSIDILRDVQSAKEQGRPYVIVFVGVNGVGKSTNLAKVAYWLLQHEVSVMMAACDTFRSGAVEQLRTHARRLQIPIFERGYEKDPAIVAKEAIREAMQTKQDVVLVDTAGRMQDNEPLMRALSKLINLNKPDLVLFVGEALVGNDAVDQLTKFNQKLADLSATGSQQLIDGILLTKFDTIDDKVGAALSMVYISGAPVMFVGCGQTYTDLKKLNVKSIIKSLLK